MARRPQPRVVIGTVAIVVLLVGYIVISMVSRALRPEQPENAPGVVGSAFGETQPETEADLPVPQRPAVLSDSALAEYTSSAEYQQLRCARGSGVSGE